MSKKITEQQIENLYDSFKKIYQQNKNNFNTLNHKEIIDKVIVDIGKEEESLWNPVSLRGYLTNLIYMIKGNEFKWTINQYAEEYFIENICKDFDYTICNNSKEALRLHKIYYSGVTNNKEEKEMEERRAEEHVLNSKQPLNQILYGPPGTGKTYNTINKALKIIFEKEDDTTIVKHTFNNYSIEKSIKELREIIEKEKTTAEERKDLKTAFDYYKKQGQIEFVTFHQSYGYEEFVEGIKATTNEETKQIEYFVELGLFKKLCKKAQDEDIFSIGQKISKYEIVYNSNDLIKLKRQNGSIIPIPKYLLKEVFDLLNNRIITTQDLHNKTAIDKMSPSTEKYIINGYHNIFRDLGEYYLENGRTTNSNKNHILIIDEINRGNISKIFGELITLIEPSKRIGADEAITLKLPNSGDDFGVPQNLYIIGTMNTADRSIAQIDTALRRRFVFEEMMPKPKLLENIKIDNTDINVSEILRAINERIEYIYDREHTIGHSYFMSLIKEPTLEKLNEIFRVNIVPLLAEYFYDDWDDIIYVLNNNFIQKKQKTKYIEEDSLRTINKVYEINDNFEVLEYQKIYSKQEDIEN